MEVRPGFDRAWQFEEIYYVAQRFFAEKGGDPFEEDEQHLARRHPNLWRRFGAEPLC
jgi:hypothetical protein